MKRSKIAAHVAIAVWAGIMACITSIKAGDAPMIPVSDSVWPGYQSATVYVPDSVPLFRFILWQQETGTVGTMRSRYALAARCVVLMGGTPADLVTAANATGHKEIPNLPVFADGANNFIPYDLVRTNFPNQVIGFYSNFPINQSIYPAWVGIFQNQDDPNASISAHVQYYGGSGTRPEIYFPNWGWPHGYYGAQTKTWMLYQKLAQLCVPADWDPLKGKPVLINAMTAAAATEWRGDPTTWHGAWPQAYARSQYPGGDPGRGVWLPDEDYAYLWRSAVSRSPTQLKWDQGDHNSGQTMSNDKCMGQPNIMVTSPSRSYDPHKTGGTDFPLFAINSAIDIQVKNGWATTVPPYDIQKLEIYDGNLKMGELASNPYNIYIFKNCILTRPGSRPLIAIATLKDGTKAMSRPSTIYVTDLFRKTSTGIAWAGSSLQRAKPSPVSAGKRNSLTMLPGALRQVKSDARMYFDIRGCRLTPHAGNQGVAVTTLICHDGR